MVFELDVWSIFSNVYSVKSKKFSN